jgi:DNA-binding helix-hairpin-helix protein with protein kinase domain
MSFILKPGQIVCAEPSRTPCEVDRFLGGGGQGEVYRAKLGGKLVALKWYFPYTGTRQQRTALETLVQRGAPSNHFLWPLMLMSAPGVPGYGYVMPLREPRFKGIVDLVKRRAEPSFRALATAGMHLAEGFWQLHAKGLAYCDISFGNVFFDPETGDIAICDNDNVGVDGQSPASVLGTPRFMAPEIVRGEALPSSSTDRFSLAVLLFLMFMVHHPLEGKLEHAIRCFDLPAMKRLYGTDPLFIFDPKNDSNRPVAGVQENPLIFWRVYPRFLRDLFTQAFTDGIRDPKNGRVLETIWRKAMVRLRDAIVYCSACGEQNFADLDCVGTAGPGKCWSPQCARQLLLPMHLRLDKQIVMLNSDTKLFPHHLDDQRPYDFSEAVAEVSRHPQDPNRWGLKNLTKSRWTATAPDGATMAVDPGRTVPLRLRMRIQFGKLEGEIGAS